MRLSLAAPASCSSSWRCFSAGFWRRRNWIRPKPPSRSPAPRLRPETTGGRGRLGIVFPHRAFRAGGEPNMWAALPDGPAAAIAPYGAQDDTRLCSSAYLDVFDCAERDIALPREWLANSIAPNEIEERPATVKRND